MADAPAHIRAEACRLAIEVVEGQRSWDDFLQAMPEEVGDDELIHELIELVGIGPPPGIVSDDAYAEYQARVREKIAQLRGEDR